MPPFCVAQAVQVAHFLAEVQQEARDYDQNYVVAKLVQQYPLQPEPLKIEVKEARAIPGIKPVGESRCSLDSLLPLCVLSVLWLRSCAAPSA